MLAVANGGPRDEKKPVKGKSRKEPDPDPHGDLLLKTEVGGHGQRECIHLKGYCLYGMPRIQDLLPRVSFVKYKVISSED